MEKASDEKMEMYAEFINLEKAYDSANSLWKVQILHYVHGRQLNAFKSFRYGSSDCIRVTGAKSKWFEINMQVHPGCVRSP